MTTSVTDYLLKMAPVITALSPLLIIWITNRLGKRKSKRDDLQSDYERVRTERDDYLQKWYTAEQEIDKLKKKLEDK